jgi:hypothetical protein
VKIARELAKTLEPEREHLGWQIYAIEGGVYGTKPGEGEFRADAITTDKEGITLRGHPEFHINSLKVPWHFKTSRLVDASNATFRINES